MARAEEELWRQMREVQPVSAAQGARVPVEEVARHYIRDAKRRGRKPSTSANVESETRVHLAPFFRGKAISAIRDEEGTDLISVLDHRGLAPKTIRNIIATLSTLANFARKRKWASVNPCEGVELPAVPRTEDVRFLTLEEVDAMIAKVPCGVFEQVDRALLLTAALTGLRRGELVALRWRDVDWSAQRIRVRRNYTRGAYGAPKSRRSSRSVPMTDEVAGVLERLYQQSRWQGDEDLVLAHPTTGEILAKSNITRRMRVALKATGLDASHRFHDLRHTFATRLASQGVPMRSLQEGHADFKTTLIYADYAPAAREAEMIAQAFVRDSVHGSNLSEPDVISEQPSPANTGVLA